jgi:MFS family permease
MTALGLPAFQAILPDLVDRDELLAATSLGLAQYNLGRVVGPALAGLVLAVGSYTWAFAINAASFGAVIVALLFVRLPRASAPGDEGGLWERIVTGVRAAAAEPGCRTAIVGIGVTALLLSPFIALIPAVALKLFGTGETGAAVLVTAQGVGAVAGAMVLAGLAERYGRRRVLVATLVTLPLVMALYGVAPTFVLATAALVVVGAVYVGVLSGLGTVVQLRAPAAVRARVLSLYMVALGVIYPVGAVLQGFLGDRLGMRQVTVGAAVLYLAVLAAVQSARPRLTETLDDLP